MRRRHHRRLLRLPAVSHLSFALTLSLFLTAFGTFSMITRDSIAPTSPVVLGTQARLSFSTAYAGYVVSLVAATVRAIKYYVRSTRHGSCLQRRKCCWNDPRKDPCDRLHDQSAVQRRCVFSLAPISTNKRFVIGRFFFSRASLRRANLPRAAPLKRTFRQKALAPGENTAATKRAEKNNGERAKEKERNRFRAVIFRPRLFYRRPFSSAAHGIAKASAGRCKINARKNRNRGRSRAH